MKRLHLAFAAVIAVAVIGCGGGGGSAPPSRGVPAASSSPTLGGSGSQSKGTGKATFSIRVPVVTAASSSKRKRPAYVSPNTASVTFAVGGTVTSTVSIQAGVAPCGPVSNGSFTCTAEANVPAGTEAITVSTYSDPSAGGLLLSTATMTETIVAGANNPLAFTLNAIVNTLIVQYSATSFTYGTPSMITATLVAIDESGATIVGPGALIDAEGNVVSASLALTGTNASDFTVGAEAGAGTTSISWPISYDGIAPVGSNVFLTASAGTTTTTYQFFSGSGSPQTITVDPIPVVPGALTFESPGLNYIPASSPTMAPTVPSYTAVGLAPAPDPGNYNGPADALDLETYSNGDELFVFFTDSLGSGAGITPSVYSNGGACSPLLAGAGTVTDIGGGYYTYSFYNLSSPGSVVSSNCVIMLTDTTGSTAYLEIYQSLNSITVNRKARKN